MWNIVLTSYLYVMYDSKKKRGISTTNAGRLMISGKALCFSSNVILFKDIILEHSQSGLAKMLLVYIYLSL